MTIGKGVVPAEPVHLVAIGRDVTACGITRPWDRYLNYSSAQRLVTCSRCRPTTADPRRNPPPGWTVQKVGSLPSMKGWKAHHPNYGWGLRQNTRREAVAEAWQVQDVWAGPSEASEETETGDSR